MYMANLSFLDFVYIQSNKSSESSEYSFDLKYGGTEKQLKFTDKKRKKFSIA